MIIGATVGAVVAVAVTVTAIILVLEWKNGGEKGRPDPSGYLNSMEINRLLEVKVQILE